MSFVIAKGVGPKYNGSEFGCLTPGNRYEVEYISYQKDSVWIKEDFKHNPRETSFYIRIKLDDNNRPHDIWNDYFLPTDEIRDNRLNDLGI
jgi:hypothetical protein